MAAPAHDPVPEPRASGHLRDRSAAGRPAAASLITDARSASSRELSGRVRRYTITMAFRMACFLSMLFVDGWPRWVLLACAVFLPYIAVVLANQADQRTGTARMQPGGPQEAPQLPAAKRAEVIPGSVEERVDPGLDDPQRQGRVA